jgi:hypothetical protein
VVLRALVRVGLLAILEWVAVIQCAPALGWSLSMVAGAVGIRQARKACRQRWQ